jgi:cytochrome c
MTDRETTTKEKEIFVKKLYTAGMLSLVTISFAATTPLAFASGSHAGGHEKKKKMHGNMPMKKGAEKSTETDTTKTPLKKLNQKTSRQLTGRLVLPKMDPRRGKKLFVSKGCVACHSINGVGGHDAPKLDAHTMDKKMNPFDFAAKMWRAAPAMIAVQEEAFGEQINFTGDELADIAAFVHSDKEQHSFSEKDITPAARKMMSHSHGGDGKGDGHSN